MPTPGFFSNSVRIGIGIRPHIDEFQFEKVFNRLPRIYIYIYISIVAFFKNVTGTLVYRMRRS